MSWDVPRDSRGVLRGCCLACSCGGYDGGQEKKKCLTCGHPPGKHMNLDLSAPSAVTHTVHHDPGSFHSNSASTYHGSTYYQHHHQPHLSTMRQPQLPRCQADGCPNPVHYEFSLPEDLRAFTYCSPECRDGHLLPIERANLRTELEDMKKTLQEVAANEISPKPIQRQPSYEHSSAHGGVSNPSSTGSKQKGKQKTVKVEGTKERNKPFGLLLGERGHKLDKTLGLIIVGAVKGTPAYSKLQDDEIRIFDVIETVNDISCSSLLIPGIHPQESFDQHLERQASVTMFITHSIALPPKISCTLAFARKQQFEFTHVIALRYSPTCDDNAYGLTLSWRRDKVVVKGRSSETPACLSGVMFDDVIHAYAFASTENISKYQLVSDKDLSAIIGDLKKAHSTKKSVILVIQRAGQNSYV